MHDEFEEDYEVSGALSDTELIEIQEAYRRQKLKETLIGPIISTCAHVTLLIICAVFFVGETVEKNQTVEITPVVEEIPQEEPPPPPPPPEIPPPEPQEIISHDPTVTSDAVPDAADLVGAIDDVSDEPPSTDDNAETELVNDIKPSASNIVSSKMFGGRSSAGRSGALKSYGGSVAAQDSLNKALKWLASVQNPDGSWSDSGNGVKKPKGMPARFNANMRAGFQPKLKAAGATAGSQKYSVGLTGLALLAFLAHGETPKSKQYGKTVSDAISWLVNSYINQVGKSYESYSHAIRTYALSEAYAMTGNYNILDILEPSLEIIIKGQQASGSFVYIYAKNDREDLSVAGWNYQAMKAAKGAHVEIDGLQEAIGRSVAHLRKKAASKNDGKSFTYNKVRKSDHRMRAVGVLCLQLFGQGEIPELKDELNLIATEDLAKFKWDNAPQESLYGWYYATQCMFQVGGNKWKAWNAVFQKELKGNQNPAGYWEYPGKSHGPKSDHGMKVYATCFCSLMLTVYYRYLPMTAKGGAKKAAAKNPVQKAKAAGEEDIDIF